MVTTDVVDSNKDEHIQKRWVAPQLVLLSNEKNIHGGQSGAAEASGLWES